MNLLGGETAAADFPLIFRRVSAATGKALHYE